MISNNTARLMAFLFLLLGSTQCNTQSSISGNIQLQHGWKPILYLIQPRSFAEIVSNFSGTVLDSARIDRDGNFQFSHIPIVNEPSLFEICIQQNGNPYPNRLMDDDPTRANYMPIVWQKGASIRVTADASRFQASFSLKDPSPENRALLQLRDIRHRLFQQERSLLLELAPSDETTLMAHEDALLRYQTPLMSFADSSTYLFPALVAARWVSPKSDYERVPEFLVKLCEKWRSLSPQNAWALQLCNLGNRESMPLLIGDTMLDYPLPMSTGDTVKLHTLLGSRITILDVWASWCMPCRQENREVLVPLWAQYKDHGLQILGYSIDANQTAWKAAIAKDGAGWVHASHLSGDETPFLKALRITTIPANFILDDHGVVIAKNLHGEALRTFLEGYLK